MTREEFKTESLALARMLFKDEITTAEYAEMMGGLTEHYAENRPKSEWPMPWEPRLPEKKDE